MSSLSPNEVMRRIAALALLAVVSLVVIAAQAQAATVQITPTEGRPVTLDLDQLPAPPDITNRTYTLRSDSGESQVTVSGYSFNAILEMAGIDPIVVGYFEIARPGGGALLISRRQATTEGAFSEGPPVIFRDSEGLHFLRPSAGGSDYNAADLISLPQNATLAIRARSGTLVQVSAKASKRKVKVGEQVSFTATLDRSAAGEDVEFSWYFDDGASAKGPEVTHRFRRPGLYDIVVGVTTPGDRVGASATVTVQVGSPKKQGPKRRGGGTNKAKNAPDSGASEGGSGPGQAGPPPSGGSGPSYPPADSGPSFVPSPPAPDPAPEPEPETVPEKKPEPRGDQITGQLLAATDIEPLDLSQPTTPSKTSEQPPAARTGSEDPIGGGGIPGAAFGVGTALLLLAGGGLLEARGIGRFRW